MKIEVLPSQHRGSTALRLAGRIDHETSPSLSTAIESATAGSVALDMSECSFISSAGLRVLLLAHQQLTRKGHKLSLLNVPPVIYPVFEVTGLDQLLHVERAPRMISLDGAELISSGACGDCYRLDAETVVKLYREGVDPGIAEKEKKYAKAALLLGLPTALSYDVVACGPRTGVVYEMIDAELFSAIIKDDPAHTVEYGQMLSGIAKGVHSIKGDPAVFPRIKNQFVDYIAELGAFLPQPDIAFLNEQLQLIPESETCVHFDLHSSNIMIRRNEPIIIDLGDLSIGSYLFDIGLVYMIYGLPELGFCEMVTKMPADQGVRFCESFISSYFADRPAEEYEFFYRNRFFLASLRAIYTVTFLPYLRPKMIDILRDILLPRMRAGS